MSSDPLTFSQQLLQDQLKALQTQNDLLFRLALTEALRQKDHRELRDQARFRACVEQHLRAGLTADDEKAFLILLGLAIAGLPSGPDQERARQFLSALEQRLRTLVSAHLTRPSGREICRCKAEVARDIFSECLARLPSARLLAAEDIPSLGIPVSPGVLADRVDAAIRARAGANACRAALLADDGDDDQDSSRSPPASPSAIVSPPAASGDRSHETQDAPLLMDLDVGRLESNGKAYDLGTQAKARLADLRSLEEARTKGVRDGFVWLGGRQRHKHRLDHLRTFLDGKPKRGTSKGMAQPTRPGLADELLETEQNRGVRLRVKPQRADLRAPSVGPGPAT